LAPWIEDILLKRYFSSVRCSGNVFSFFVA
jgi:hypothetical protein